MFSETNLLIYTLMFPIFGILMLLYLLKRNSIINFCYSSKKLNRITYSFLIFSFFIFLMVYFLFALDKKYWLTNIPYLKYFLMSDSTIPISLWFIFFTIPYFLLIMDFFFISKKPENILEFNIFLALRVLLLFSPVLMFFVIFLLINTKLFYSVFGYLHENEKFFLFITCPILYVMILPGIGIVSQGLFKLTDKIQNKNFIMLNSVLIAFLGHFGWLFSIIIFNLDLTNKLFLIIYKFLLLLPLFFILINWLFILNKSKHLLKLNSSTLFIVGYISTMFLGVFVIFSFSLYNITTTIEVKYIIFEYHYFLSNLIIFSIFVGFYLYYNKIVGFYFSEILGMPHFLFCFLGMILAYLPYSLTGLKTVRLDNEIFINTLIKDLSKIVYIGNCFLVFSLVVFFIVLLESFLKKRTTPDYISFSKILNFEKYKNKLDFLIAVCFLIYGIIFFVLCVINSIYWILICYVIASVIIILLIKSQKTKIFLSPLTEGFSKVYVTFKDYWPILYYTSHFIKIIYLGSCLYVMAFLKIRLIDLSPTTDFNHINLILELSSPVSFIRILTDIFVITISVETFIRLYIIFSLNNQGEFKIPDYILNKPNPTNKSKRRNFSTLAAAPVFHTSALGAGTRILRRIVIGGKTYWVISPVIAPALIALTAVGGSIAIVNTLKVELPNHISPFPYINKSFFQDLSHWFEYGYTFEHSDIYARHKILELTFLGQKKGYLKELVLHYLSESGSRTLTLEILNKIVADPAHAHELSQLRLGQQYEVGFFFKYSARHLVVSTGRSISDYVRSIPDYVRGIDRAQIARNEEIDQLVEQQERLAYDNPGLALQVFLETDQIRSEWQLHW